MRTSLDLYLTESQDDYSLYLDKVYDEMSNDFVSENEHWLFDRTQQVDKWVYNLYNKGKDPKIAAKIIEKAFCRYFKKGIYIKNVKLNRGTI